MGQSAFCLLVDLERHTKFWNSYWGDIRVMFVVMDVAASHGSKSNRIIRVVTSSITRIRLLFPSFVEDLIVFCRSSNCIAGTRT